MGDVIQFVISVSIVSACMFLVVVLPLGVVVWSSRRIQQKRDLTWKSIAQRAELTFSQKRILLSLNRRVTGIFRGRELTLQVIGIEDEEPVIDLVVNNPENIQLSVSAAAAAWFGKLFGKQYTLSGDEELDRKLSISCKPPEMLRAFIRVKRFNGWLRREPFPKIWLYGDKLRVEPLTFKPDQMIYLFNMMSDLADLIENSPTPDHADLTDMEWMR